MGELGRRERKRLETQRRIAEAARALFSRHGFAAVTVAQVAEAADVSPQTVYNHFPTKEDLVFWRRGVFEEQLLAAVRDRPAGESALAAFHRFLAQPRGLPTDAERGARPPAAGLMGAIVESASLQARERAIMADCTSSLARLLADDTGARPGDLEPWVAAGAMLAAAQGLIDYARQRVIAGARPPGLTREVRTRADRAVALLEQGLGEYAVRPEQA